MQVHPSFNKMVDNAIRMEDVLIKKGDISPWKETQPGSSSKEKNKYWKYGKDNNKNVVNDRVVDTVKTNSKPTILTWLVARKHSKQLKP